METGVIRLVSESVGTGTIELNKIYCGDALTILKTFPDECVDTCITSPPYWGLRDYGVEGQIGLEKTPEEYVEKLVIVFREVRRVLKKTGTLWLNLGDSYGQNYRWGKERNKWHLEKRSKGEEIFMGTKPLSTNLKPKNLLGIPWMVAFALRDDGWYLRSDIIWAKVNPMPESVRDRPTKAHEYIFLMSKSEKYFYDADAIREPLTESTITREKNGYKHAFASQFKGSPEDKRYIDGKVLSQVSNPLGRNKRSVWFIPTEPFPEAHFATFPKALVEPCVKAGTSEKGNCPKCGAPWKRIVKDAEWYAELKRRVGSWHDHSNDLGAGMSQKKKKEFISVSAERYTIGWRPTCSCGIEEAIPAIVLDPFMGSGTVGLVAKSLGRNYIGIELNPEYVEMAERRINGELFANKVLVR